MNIPSSVIDPSSSYALVIGIGRYADERIPQLKCTNADAMSFYQLLLDKKHAGFNEENMMLLIDEQATLYKIKNAVSHWLYKHADEDSTVLVFFAGHGGQESDKTHTEPDGISKYLLPYDCDRDDLFSSALSSSEFNRMLSTVKARRTVFFMDACYAGGVTRAGARDVGVVNDIGDKLSQGEGRIVITSAKHNQRSWEDASLGHGIFTHHLLEALNGRADNDEDGYVSVLEIFKYLKDKVPMSARQLANSDQDPLFCGDMTSDIFITANAELVLKKKKALQEQEAQMHQQRQENQKLLFEIYSSGKMPTNIYQEAVHLLDQNPESFTASDRKLFYLLLAVIKKVIPMAEYLETREIIKSGTVKKPVPRQAEEPQKAQLQFCTNCGSRVNPSLAFCTNCGHKLH